MQNNSNHFLLCGHTPFFKPVLRQREATLNEEAQLCFWQSFCPVGCYRYTVSSLLLILPVRHKITPSHLRKNAAGWCFSEYHLVWHCRASREKQRKACHWEELQSCSILNPCPSLWRLRTWRVTTIPAHQVLPPTQKMPASAHRTGTEQAWRTNSTFCKTEVRLLDINQSCSPLRSVQSFVWSKHRERSNPSAKKVPASLNPQVW